MPREEGSVEDVDEGFVDKEGFEEEGNDNGACVGVSSCILSCGVFMNGGRSLKL